MLLEGTSTARLTVPYGEDGGPRDSDAEIAVDTLNSLLMSLNPNTSVDAFMEDVESLLSDLSALAHEVPASWPSECGDVPIGSCDPPLSAPPATGDALVGQPRTMADVTPVPPGNAWVADGNMSPCELDLVSMLWGFLVSNLDLVEWSLCAARASNPPNSDIHENPAGPGCVIERILGTRANRVHIELGTCNSDGHLMEANAGARPLAFRQAIRFCEHHQDMQAGLAVFCGTGCDISDMEACMECVVVHLASSLLHEITHLCWYEHQSNPTLECSVPYLTGNFFSWAAFQRFPQSMDCPSCEVYDGLEFGVDDASPDLLPPC